MKNLPLSLKVVAGYLIFVGFLGIIWLLFTLGTQSFEIALQSLEANAWLYFKSSLYNVFFIMSGVGILLKKQWARGLGLTLLVLGTFSTANEFAWGRAGGPPAIETLILSFVVVGLWNAIWFYLLYKKSNKLALETNSGI